MFSSDSCCFRNGQLKQLNDEEGWEKQKHFIQAKTLEKNSCKPELKQKKQQKIQPLTLLYTIFHEKGTPFRKSSITEKWFPFHIPYLELRIPFDCFKCIFFT